MTDDIVNRCKDCFNLETYCSCPEHQQFNDRRRAVEARNDLRCAMWVGQGMSGAPIHPDYYKWWETKGKPNSKELFDIMDKSMKVLDDYVAKYGEGQ